MIAELKKYRLGNQSEEFKLREDFLGWKPKDSTWTELCLEWKKNLSIEIVSPRGETKTIFLHQFFSKNAFPLSFFGEERADDWHIFAIVSECENSERFIASLHDSKTSEDERNKKLAILRRYGLGDFCGWEDGGINLLYRQIVEVVPVWIDRIIEKTGKGYFLLKIFGVKISGEKDGEWHEVEIKNRSSFFKVSGREYISEVYSKAEKRVATATMNKERFLQLMKDLGETELSRFTVIKAKQIDDGDYWQVTLETENFAGFLLESSLKDGILREFGKEFSFI
ncbi:MAG: hypothetical protein Q7T50_07860 [Candidatus Magasanikbacteria bacterium]|nr:hypothetical protein [Candidatus Magasanikbacteria bacterium]